jgi:hypothetical protein
MNCQHNLVLQMFVDEGRFGKVTGPCNAATWASSAGHPQFSRKKLHQRPAVNSGLSPAEMLGEGVGEERCRDHATPPSLAASGSSVNTQQAEESSTERWLQGGRARGVRTRGQRRRLEQELTAAALRLRMSEKGGQEERQRREETSRAAATVSTSASYLRRPRDLVPPRQF